MGGCPAMDLPPLPPSHPLDHILAFVPVRAWAAYLPRMHEGAPTPPLLLVSFGSWPRAGGMSCGRCMAFARCTGGRKEGRNVLHKACVCLECFVGLVFLPSPAPPPPRLAPAFSYTALDWRAALPRGQGTSFTWPPPRIRSTRLASHRTAPQVTHPPHPSPTHPHTPTQTHSPTSTFTHKPCPPSVPSTPHPPPPPPPQPPARKKSRRPNPPPTAAASTMP